LPESAALACRRNTEPPSGPAKTFSVGIRVKSREDAINLHTEVTKTTIGGAEAFDEAPRLAIGQTAGRQECDFA
jgi:hypothetical protein